MIRVSSTSNGKRSRRLPNTTSSKGKGPTLGNQRIKGINLQEVINLQLNRAKSLLNEGQELGSKLTGFFGFEIRLIIQSAKEIIKKLENRDNIYIRPTIKKWEYPRIIWNTLF